MKNRCKQLLPRVHIWGHGTKTENNKYRKDILNDTKFYLSFENDEILALLITKTKTKKYFKALTFASRYTL